MRSLERRFKNIQDKNPLLSSYICYSMTVRGQGFHKEAIERHFNLIDKDDYTRKDKPALIEYLFELSNS